MSNTVLLKLHVTVVEGVQYLSPKDLGAFRISGTLDTSLLQGD